MSNTNATDLVYLKPNTKIEPLCYRWWAWPHLVSPAQLAFNIVHRLIPMLRSFIANPSVHVATTRDPKFLCAPFLHLKESDVPTIRALLDKMTAECSHLIHFADDFLKFERQLLDSAKGYSLDDFYDKLPPSLAGLIELTYDLNNHPHMRLIEELLYDQALPNEAGQEFIFMNEPDNQRDFFLNTPRVDRPDRFVASIPFRDKRIDLVAASRIKPTSFADLVEAFEVDADKIEVFRSFFTESAPPRIFPNYQGDDVRLGYFGHACVLIQTADVSILVDPMVAWQSDDAAARLAFADLPDVIDYVFLTHNHQDHFCPEVMLQLRSRIGTVVVPRNNANTIADPSLKLTLRHLGFDSVQVMDPLDEIALPHGRMTSLPFYGEHSDLSINSKHGMLLEIKDRRFAFLADANCTDRVLYRRLAERIGKVDALFIGMECHGAPLTWLYGVYMANAALRKDDESRRLSGSNSDRAWAVVEELGCTRVYVYAMGQEPWLKHLLGLEYSPDSIQIVESNRFVQRCRDAGFISERLYGCQEMMF